MSENTSRRGLEIAHRKDTYQYARINSIFFFKSLCYLIAVVRLNEYRIEKKRKKYPLISACAVFRVTQSTDIRICKNPRHVRTIL